MTDWSVAAGDCRELLATLPPDSIDAIVTDPPAGISFSGARWDSDLGGRDKWIAWLEGIFREAFRVLKPGGHAVVWSLPRTSHWTATAIENAGFEIRDKLVHLFGSGFPKSLSVSRAIDKRDGTLGNREVVHRYSAGGNAGTSTKKKGGTYGVGVETSEPIELAVTRGASETSRAWDGWGTALKPSAEYWILARKPLEGTVVDNVLKWGVGALNIDGCRVATDWNEPDRPESWMASGHSDKPDADKIAAPPGKGIECHPGGRWPPNAVFCHLPGCERVGTKRVKVKDPRRRDGSIGVKRDGEIYGSALERVPTHYVGSDGLESQVAYQCQEGCPVAELARQSGVKTSGFMAKGTKRKTRTGYSGHMPHETAHDTYADTGTAARFFPGFEYDSEIDVPFLYVAKAGTKERDAGLDAEPGKRANTHATVKPIALMRWLVRLVTPPNGRVLDLFLGSGTTGIAAVLEGREFVGFDLEPQYVELARKRIAHHEPKQGSMFS